VFDRILILQHRGGEYISLNISGLTSDREPIWETLDRAREKLKRPSTTSNVALQILDSNLTKDEIERITEWLKNMKSEIFRLAVIGATFRERRLMKKACGKADLHLNWTFLYDWDRAKDWLVGKPEGGNTFGT